MLLGGNVQKPLSKLEELLLQDAARLEAELEHLRRTDAGLEALDRRLSQVEVQLARLLEGV